MSKTTEEKIADYYSLKPTQFSALKSLTLGQVLDANGYTKQKVSLVLARDIEDKGECLYLDFFDVHGTEIQQPETSHIVLSHVEIIPGNEIPDIQGTYLVRDAEQERIVWFQCEDFEVVVG